MSEIIRYTKSGHKFVIDGVLEPGQTITVTVIPADGYKFDEWVSGDDNIESIEPDKEGHSRFSIYIEECGLSFAATFSEIDLCDKERIYKELIEILGDTSEPKWDSAEEIDCDLIDEILEEILSGGIPEFEIKASETEVKFINPSTKESKTASELSLLSKFKLLLANDNTVYYINNEKNKTEITTDGDYTDHDETTGDEEVYINRETDEDNNIHYTFEEIINI